MAGSAGEETEKKTGYFQIRAETLVPSNTKEGPKAAPNQKIRAVNGLSTWTWIKNPMRCWKIPDHKFLLDQEAHAGHVKILCTECEGMKAWGFLYSESLSRVMELNLK